MDPLDAPSALEKQIERLEALRTVLGDALTDAKKAELKDRLRALIETEGGAVIAGPVAAGRDFVGRDKYEINLAIGPHDPPDRILVAYHRSLAAECRRLPLGVIDTRFVRAADESTIPLPDIYVNLDVAAPASPWREEGQRAWALRLLRPEVAERLPVLEALSAPEHARAVLLGGPGSGKSTLVHYLAWLLATGAPELPEPLRGGPVVRLILREVAAHHVPEGCARGTAAMLWDALERDLRQRLGEGASQRLFPYLQERLMAEGGVLLLDGLDEVPEADRRRVALLEAVQALAQTLPEAARLLVTARPYAYADPHWHLSGFPILSLAPFSEAQVERFIERWYHAVRSPMGWSEETAQAKGGQLREALHERPYLGNLASRPLLLTLMTTLHTSWGQLPEDRAGLYEEVVKLLIGRWQRAREVRGPTGEPVIEPGISQALKAGEDRIRMALEHLAYEVHERQRREPGRDQTPADICEGELLVAFKPLLGDVAPVALFSYLEHRVGLLVAPREGVYAFPHRSFQEYLAACHLANRPDVAVGLRDKVREDPAWWGEVFLLGVGKGRQGGLGPATHIVHVLLPEDVDDAPDRQEIHWKLAVLAAQALEELRLHEQGKGDPYYEAILRRARGWLVQLVEEGRLAPRERLAAGDILGRLGNPRFDAGGFYLPKRYRGAPEPFLGFVEVPAGPFTMGSVAGDEMAFDDERPACALDLPGFHIARYPVTNAQYRCFVAARGYEAREYWTEEGWNWRQGADPDLRPIDDKDVRRRYAEWLANRPAEKRSKPYFWEQPPWNAATRPIVGVSWYEALAYCRWLTEQLNGRLRAKGGLARGERYLVRLPTEAEWEKAARGTGAHRWPWGEEWQEGAANTAEAKLEQTSPVGLFPAGASPCGALDMAGNGWEWTSSRWGRTSVSTPDYGYPYRPEDGRETLAGPDLRAVRGGSWIRRSPGRALCVP